MKQRLHMIANMVTPGNSVADIGTDHGFLPIELVRSGKCPYAIAMDIVEGPLMRAKAHIDEARLSDKIKCRLSDGFDKLEVGEVDTAVVAGMGGDLISNIISRKPGVAKELVLSPHTHWETVRIALRENGYCITDESMLLDDNKFYVIIKAINSSNTQKETNQIFDHFGPVLIARKDETLKQYLNKELYKFQNIGQKRDYIELVRHALDLVR